MDEIANIIVAAKASFQRVNMDDIAKIIASGKDIVLAIAAAVTATVAVRGLNKWHHEMSGKTEYEAARSLIKAAYRVREELRNARSPVIWGGEFPDANRDADAYRHVYNARFVPVFKAMTDFDTATLEAETLWGQEVRGPADDLRKCVNEVRVAMEAIISDKEAQGHNFTDDRDFGKRMRAAAHASFDDAKNEVNEKIRRAVEAIEVQARRHMKP